MFQLRFPTRLFVLFVIFILVLNSSLQAQIKSPNGQVMVTFELKDGRPFYAVQYQNQTIVQLSKLGFTFQNTPPLNQNFEIVTSNQSTYDQTWEQPWGEKRWVRDHHNEWDITLQETTDLHRLMKVVFRVFDNGVGFRYEIPEQTHVDSLIILDEETEFNLAEDFTAWWIPAYQNNRYEYLYSQNLVSQLDTVHTPLTLCASNGLHLAIHEAALTDYASMTLARSDSTHLTCDLVPWSDGIKVKTAAPMKSPWRTIMIGETAGDLITNYMTLNLNEPCVLENLSWITPNKYMGIWWGMHIGKYNFFESDNHGATTENAKMYVDFAAKHNIPRLLIEGWNTGWTPEWYLDAMHMFSFTQSTPDFNLEAVNAYAQSKNVQLIGYHETGSNLINYLKQIDDGMGLYHKLGIHDIKIGQVGSRLNMKEWHHGQFGVNYYRFVLKKAAEYQLAVNFHEPIKDTGERRTYPNMMCREGARGQEYNAWSEGNPPSHTVILPFTRMLCGPMDFTPGVLDVTIKERAGRSVHTTVAKQLAFYVTFFSPIQMMADLPENYDGNPAFQFLLDVPCDWEDTQVLNGEVGEYLTMVRKDRHSNDWYLGSITNEKSREFEIQCDFLESGKEYQAEIYADGPDANWQSNPLPVSISKKTVDAGAILKVKLAAGGGQAIRFHAVEE